MLAAYIDETGHPEQETGIFGFAGFIGRIKDWTNFEQQWRRSCPDHLYPFHMTKFVNAKLPDASQRLVLGGLLPAITQNNLVPFETIVSLSEYHSLKARQKKKIGNLYYVMLAHVMNQIGFAVLGAAENSNGPMPSMPNVSITFAKSEFSGRAAEWWWESKGSGLGASLAAIVSGLLIDRISVGKPEEVIPLQAADLWAYELGHHYRYILPNKKPIRWPFKEINQLPAMQGVAKRSYSVLTNDQLLASGYATLV